MQTLDDILTRAADDALAAIPNGSDARLARAARHAPRRGRRLGFVAVAVLAFCAVVVARGQIGQLDQIHVVGLSTVPAPHADATDTTTPSEPVEPVGSSPTVASDPMTANTIGTDKGGAVIAPTTILLVGLDRRDRIGTLGETQLGAELPRADTIMLVTLDPIERRIAVLSLPRDLWVDDGAGRTSRLASFGDDPSRLVDVVDRLVPGGINHYAAIDMDGLIALVDLIGGVRVRFDRPTRDRNTGLSVGIGCERFDGEEALAYARSRRLEIEAPDGVWIPDTTSSIGRDTRQRDLFRRIVAGVLTSDYSTVDQVRIAIDVLDDMTVDEALDASRLRQLFATARTIGANGFVSFDLANAVNSETVDKQAVLVPDAQAVAAVVESFRTGFAASVPDEAEVDRLAPIVPATDC